MQKCARRRSIFVCYYLFKPRLKKSFRHFGRAAPSLQKTNGWCSHKNVCITLVNRLISSVDYTVRRCLDIKQTNPSWSTTHHKDYSQQSTLCRWWDYVMPSQGKNPDGFLPPVRICGGVKFNGRQRFFNGFNYERLTEQDVAYK